MDSCVCNSACFEKMFFTQRPGILWPITFEDWSQGNQQSNAFLNFEFIRLKCGTKSDQILIQWWKWLTSVCWCLPNPPHLAQRTAACLNVGLETCHLHGQCDWVNNHITNNQGTDRLWCNIWFWFDQVEKSRWGWHLNQCRTWATSTHGMFYDLIMRLPSVQWTGKYDGGYWITD